MKMHENVCESVLQAIGNTPLVRIPFDDVPARVYAKLEYMNPGGSVKDRAALFMINEAERKGLLKPGGTVIEGSSGNQGIAAALIALLKGYKAVITVSEKVSAEKKATLTAYGAKVVICKSTSDFLDPEGYFATAQRLSKEIPNSYFLSQYTNSDNPLGHYYGLAPEIWFQTSERITHFITAMGSGGTICGVGRYLKERNPKIKIIGVDAATSFRSTGGHPKPYKSEGIGIDFDSPHLKNAPIDDAIGVTDDEMVAMINRMAKEYGFMIGGAGASSAHAVYEYAKKLTPDDYVVTIFGDSGKSYVSKGFFK